MKEQLEQEGFVILKQAVPIEKTTAVLRTLHNDIFNQGISKRELEVWKREACWFPEFRTHNSIKDLAAQLPAWAAEGVPCEPQILLSFPYLEKVAGPLWSHIDQEPPWAAGRKYSTIVGVPLTPFCVENGGVNFWKFHSDEVITPNLEVGDIFVMHPRLPHSGGYNLTGGIRYAVYFRYLYDKPS